MAVVWRRRGGRRKWLPENHLAYVVRGVSD